MQILYDGWIFGVQSAGGINRYFANIIDWLPPTFAPFLLSARIAEVNFPSNPNLKVFRYRKFRPGRISNQIEKLYFRRVTQANAFDLAHPTYYWTLTGRELTEYRCPVVVTVHDMIHEILARETDPTGVQAEIKRRAIMAADKIICVSGNTKKDLLERYPAVEDKIHVIYNAHGIDESMSHGAEAVPSRPYFIHVGSRSAGYKNFDCLLSAFAKVAERNKDAVLCVVGASFDRREYGLIKELNLSERIEHYGYASDAHLAKLYRHSIALLYPSLYEGFGIPPLEAMACGTAVIASNCSSIPEVVGDAGMLFNPRANDELTEAMFYLLNNPAKRDELIDKGKHRVEMFSWDKTTKQTVDVYHQVTDGKYQVQT